MLKMLKGHEEKLSSFRDTYVCKSELSIDNRETVLYLISSKAYNHDAMWRTVRKADTDAKINAKNKDNVINWLYEEIEKYLVSDVDSQEDFDNWHKSMCLNLTDKINNEVLIGYKPIHMGKAQKVINMSFKYLSSLDNSEKYERKFEFCHIPLDDNILNWYYSNIAMDLPKSSRKNWSNLEYEDYINIQEDFRTYCSNTEYVPLSLEWKIF